MAPRERAHALGVALLVDRPAARVTHRKRGDTRQMNVADQVKVKRADRIRMVSMKPVKPEPPKTEDDDE
jgi:NADH-quinone oxidoreductase subunit J